MIAASEPQVILMNCRIVDLFVFFLTLQTTSNARAYQRPYSYALWLLKKKIRVYCAVTNCNKNRI